MPEIKYNMQSEPEPEPTAPEPSTQQVAAALANAGIKAETLEEQIEKILHTRKAKVVESLKPQEPDWANLTEDQAMHPSVYIPVIEHDVPEYMNVKLADTEYEVVWANRDQRRIGQLEAEGYEFLRKGHVHKDFKLPLKFDSEGNYTYADVIAMRVHKKILFGKRRRIQEQSRRQLKPQVAQANAKNKLIEQTILGDPGLDHAFSTGGLGFYNTDI